ncbi:MAG TPA: hypothetical protein VNT58_00850 [Gaiellaceae bacterium]|nr:hypothetical protein [Gaiellaceae bacterium]
MKLGLRSILLLVAVVLFILAVLIDDNYGDLVALGLAAFAGAFLADAMGWADRTAGGRRNH